MRRILVLVLLAGIVLAAEESARACSCAAGDPRHALAEADAAFVGRLVSRSEPTPDGGVIGSGQEVTWSFRIERSVKGDLGSRVDVRSPWSGASCGLEVGEGERTGLLLLRRGPAWTSGLCAQMDPDVLLRAAEPPPAPKTRPPAVEPSPSPSAPAPSPAASTVTGDPQAAARPEPGRPHRAWPTTAATGLLALAAGWWAVLRRRA